MNACGSVPQLISNMTRRKYENKKKKKKKKKKRKSHPEKKKLNTNMWLQGDVRSLQIADENQKIELNGMVNLMTK